MLNQADNELLCRIGPGTPMGNVFRRFWNPIAMSEQAPGPDGDPVRLEILGEHLVLFRDTEGHLGLLEEGCPHRGASLALGRVEQGGIRCLFHGWKFDREGRTLEVPNHQDPHICQRVRARAYRVQEAAGFIWAYMGPAEHEPPFPHWLFFDIRPEHVRRVRLYTNVNYMQQFEGGTDSSHVGILHSNFARPTWMTGEFQATDDADNPAALLAGDLAPELLLEDTDFGFHYAALRKLPATADGQAPKEHNVRVVPVVMPSTRVIPALAMQYLIFEIPVNDTRTVTFGASYRLDGGPVDFYKINEISGRHDPELMCPETFEYRGSWANRFGQDRATMQTDWSGIKGVAMEDLAISMSQGRIADRTREHLVSADRAVVRARRQLLESARRVAQGGDPIGTDVDHSTIKGVDENRPLQAPWQDLVPGHRARETPTPEPVNEGA